MSPRFSIRPLSTLSDGRLAELAGGGDERAFETLIGRHRVELSRYCWRLGLPDHRAEDVLQQAFTRAWMALRDGSEVGQPRAWLYRIVHNAALNSHRGARLRAHESLDTLVSGPLALAQSDDFETRLLALDALRAVAALPQMQREAVVMTAIEGRSHEEAAGELGLSDGAVRGLLHRARTKLRAAAAALTPQGLLELLGRVSSGGALAGRPLEAGAGAAGAGVAGALVKGAALTAVAGLLAGGALTRLDNGSRHASALPAPKPHASRRPPAALAAFAAVPRTEPAGAASLRHAAARLRSPTAGTVRRRGARRGGSELIQRGPDTAEGRGEGPTLPALAGTHDRSGSGEAGGALSTRDGGGDAQAPSAQEPGSTDGSTGDREAASSGGQTEGGGGSGDGGQVSGSTTDSALQAGEPVASGGESGGSQWPDGSRPPGGD